MVNHQQEHYDRYSGWQPIKARKLEVLNLIRYKEVVAAHDLMEEFGYTYSSARCRLSRLGKEGFLHPLIVRGTWVLTDKGYRKLDYHGMIEEEPDLQLRRQRRAEGRIWFFDGRGIGMATTDSEFAVAVTLDEAVRIRREWKKEGLI